MLTHSNELSIFQSSLDIKHHNQNIGIAGPKRESQEPAGVITGTTNT